jgi:hypothetical protein
MVVLTLIVAALAADAQTSVAPATAQASANLDRSGLGFLIPAAHYTHPQSAAHGIF